jgi:hypothetical protein
MAAQPGNPKLWNRLKAQAIAKYPHQAADGKLSFAAAKWIKEEYIREGGNYVNSINEVDPKNRDFEAEEKTKEKNKKQAKKRAMKKANLVV